MPRTEVRMAFLALQCLKRPCLTAGVSHWRATGYRVISGNADKIRQMPATLGQSGYAGPRASGHPPEVPNLPCLPSCLRKTGARSGADIDGSVDHDAVLKAGRSRRSDRHGALLPVHQYLKTGQLFRPDRATLTDAVALSRSPDSGSPCPNSTAHRQTASRELCIRIRACPAALEEPPPTLAASSRQDANRYACDSKTGGYGRCRVDIGQPHAAAK